MKRLLVFLLVVLPFYIVAQSCSRDDDPLIDETKRPLPPSNPDNDKEDDTDDNNTNDDIPMNREIRISISGIHYTATLEDNSTAKAFAALLPHDSYHD